MSEKNVTSFRDAIESLKGRNEILIVKGEVDPIYEISGIQKALDNGPALFFENIKGYHGVRNCGNLYSQIERVASFFGLVDHRQLKFKFLDAMRKPVRPRVVEEASCQEVIIKDDIDIMSTLPIIKHSEDDAGRIIGGGVVLVCKPYVPDGSDLGFRRIHFRGRDWASIRVYRGSHLGEALHAESKEAKVPVTVNVGTSPAVSLLAAGSSIHASIPSGSDELGIAGALQDCPVEICKARTIDAYAIADSEWVIEGYIDTTQRVWESEQAEKTGKPVPFFPEWDGYLGSSRRVYKFEATAITHRRDRPIFFTPLADSFEVVNISAPMREACFYELAQRIRPDLVRDVNIPDPFKAVGGIVFQVTKRDVLDDAHVRNILRVGVSLSAVPVAIAVDQDVDIYCLDEVVWAVNSRSKAKDVIQVGNGGFEGGCAIDATVPFAERRQWQRAHYPTNRVDLSKWFSETEVNGVRAQQSQYARVQANMGG